MDNRRPLFSPHRASGRSAFRFLPHAGDGLYALAARLGWNQRRCVLCLEPFTLTRRENTVRETTLCPQCRQKIAPRTSGYCPRCGEPAAQAEDPVLTCGQCRQDPPPWEEFRFYGIFAGAFRDLLHKAKYGGSLAALEVAGRLLAEACDDLPPPDVIVPMPLHSTRLRERGYNQSREIARSVARLWRAPIQDDVLVRRQSTLPQTGLDRRKRLRNLDGVFWASPTAEGRHILLIDDTATTGTSLRQACQALLAAGARRVDVAVVAHTSLHEGGVPASTPQQGQPATGRWI